MTVTFNDATRQLGIGEIKKQLLHLFSEGIVAFNYYQRESRVLNVQRQL